jgi:hypothetical protein
MGLVNKDHIRLNWTAGQSKLEGGHGTVQQASVRKILEMVDAQEGAAMPPMSPQVFLSWLKAPLPFHDVMWGIVWVLTEVGLTMRDICSLEHTDNIGLFVLPVVVYDVSSESLNNFGESPDVFL